MWCGLLHARKHEFAKKIECNEVAELFFASQRGVFMWRILLLKESEALTWKNPPD
jgi:hypothetical protein